MPLWENTLWLTASPSKDVRAAHFREVEMVHIEDRAKKWTIANLLVMLKDVSDQCKRSQNDRQPGRGLV